MAKTYVQLDNKNLEVTEIIEDVYVVNKKALEVEKIDLENRLGNRVAEIDEMLAEFDK